MKLYFANFSINSTDFSNVKPCYSIASYLPTETPTILCLFFNVFIGSIAAVTVCGNLLVIIAIIYFRQLHTPTNALILSLAVADLLVGAVVFPLTIEFSLSSCMYHEDLLCKVRSSFDITLSTCSILNLCCISIDRYYAVCQPLTYRTKVSSHVVVVMILVSWGVPAAVAIALVGFNRTKCRQNCFFTVVLGKILIVLITFYSPLLVMICIYLKIFFVAQRQVYSIHSIKNSGGSVSIMERKATKTLAIVMGVFLLCWLPSFLCTTILTFSNASKPGPLIEILNWLALSNSTFNPFIYALFYSWFRSAFKMIISGKIILGDFTNFKLV
ncbi:trace amine-associated receptor 1-like [Girardinichthys multiradiatus]|uniref:trace amine-associated receptor 1-like n=1 Tax=Girardinichthys multiradiatus TaxID=208333 RepID=UPI001FAD0FAB|nr:trace amine-associated receptor 1-like [Girardinichthys multiradiatus]